MKRYSSTLLATTPMLDMAIENIAALSAREKFSMVVLFFIVNLKKHSYDLYKLSN